MRYNIYTAKLEGKNTTAQLEQVYQTALGQDSFVKSTSYVWPLWLGSLLLGHILKGPDDFIPAQYNSWKNWQITTTKNWYSQALGYHDQVASCDFDCSNQIVKDQLQDTLVCPVVAITAYNKDLTCEDKNLDPKTDACKTFLANRDAIITLAQEMSSLGAKGGGVYSCG